MFVAIVQFLFVRGLKRSSHYCFSKDDAGSLASRSVGRARQRCPGTTAFPRVQLPQPEEMREVEDAAGLGEFRIRDLNDEINKLLREKGHWEDRIKELGGPDYAKVGPKMLDQEGREVPGNRGYKYFGAAKDLPGVRELFEQEPPPPPRRTRAEIMRDIDADYYGYRDDDDGVLVPLEQEQEKIAIAKAVRQWKAKKKGVKSAAEGEQATASSAQDEEDIYAVEPESDEEMDDEPTAESSDEQARFIAHVPVPSQKEIEEALVRRKKMELLEKYASDVLQQEAEEVKEMLGLQ
ncbi:hypothetical protein HPB50_019898 [Hyalomma asiaticum]|uniref:Uncharacterized protein n=1 Tax=Hyalomma asiaticum TaxID=266040 RepID=A0ACB7S4D2_HYAAI|nr:hypothetical protein HPB50_019898 [Hyalomma asiaticum]